MKMLLAVILFCVLCATADAGQRSTRQTRTEIRNKERKRMQVYARRLYLIRLHFRRCYGL